METFDSSSPELREQDERGNPDREHVMRTLETADTPILSGMQIYHNYVRPHMALDGATPAEKAGIQIKGRDKWLTIIQNASQRIKKAKQVHV